MDRFESAGQRPTSNGATKGWKLHLCGHSCLTHCLLVNHTLYTHTLSFCAAKHDHFPAGKSLRPHPIVDDESHPPHCDLPLQHEDRFGCQYILHQEVLETERERGGRESRCQYCHSSVLGLIGVGFQQENS